MSLRWGIVSAGKICHDFVNAINSYPDKGDMVVAAVAARDKARADDFAKYHNIPKVFGSYADMANSNDIDIAYVGALNPYHYELSKLFLESGKHVLCEKPLCLNVSQTESLINIAKKRNLFLMEGVWSRFSPLYTSLEKEINSGKLGQVQFVEVNLGHPIANIGRISKKELGGSAILDMGVYALQFAQFIFKNVPKVTAIGELNEEGVDLVDTVVLEYTDSRRAVLNIHSKVKLWNKATVVGTLGRSTIEDPFHFPNQLTHVDGIVENFCLHTSPKEYNFQNSAGLVYEALEVTRCIREGLIESPRMTHRNSLVLSTLMDVIRKQVGVHLDADDLQF